MQHHVPLVVDVARDCIGIFVNREVELVGGPGHAAHEQKRGIRQRTASFHRSRWPNVKIDDAHQRHGGAVPLSKDGVVVDQQRALLGPVDEHARLEHAADFQPIEQPVVGLGIDLCTQCMIGRIDVVLTDIAGRIVFVAGEIVEPFTLVDVPQAGDQPDRLRQVTAEIQFDVMHFGRGAKALLKGLIEIIQIRPRHRKRRGQSFVGVGDRGTAIEVVQAKV